MYIRFHKGIFTDAIIPTSVNTKPIVSPGDIIWYLPADIVPTKTINVTQQVQDTDPITNVLLFNEDGSIKWKMVNVLENGQPIQLLDPETNNPQVDVDGNPIYLQTVLTEDVPVTFSLLDNPTIFTPDDIAQVTISYTVVN